MTIWQLFETAIPKYMYMYSILQQNIQQHEYKVQV